MSIIVKIDNYSFMCADDSMSLLEAIEDQGIDVEYQCRQGFCGLCRLKLVEGKVTYFDEPIAFIPENYILPCCCKTKEDIVIEGTVPKEKTSV
ncbi:MAG: class I ribonucleotide reductase maintenance protein YfaE [Endozoicomonadaceae bacterium]|nr:class I ribonucleotide reductase maintenance protein YfaE [Endozoicomonadaceae bacterium]